MSLIQQRLALERMRSIGVVMTVLSTALLLLGLAVVAGSDLSSQPFALAQPAVALMLMAGGASRIVTARKRMRAFEAEFGADAGVQTRAEAPRRDSGAA